MDQLYSADFLIISYSFCMVVLPLVKLVCQVEKYEKSQRYERHNDKSNNHKQKEVASHPFIIPLYQVFRLLKEITDLVKVIECVSRPLLKIFEFIHQRLVFDMVLFLRRLKLLFSITKNIVTIISRNLILRLYVIVFYQGVKLIIGKEVLFHQG